MEVVHPEAAFVARLVWRDAAAELQKNQTRYAAGAAPLISTSFNLSLGGTVVVGTSRMRGGNKALIVLVTAVSRSVKARP